jgi:hypothetical protein
MRLSTAIIEGAKLRPESHQDRFCNVEGRGLCSDVWGAACEAVSPQLAKLNWTRKDKLKFESAMNTLRAVQQHYFGPYFQMPARCPGAQQALVKAGARVINRRGEFKIEGQRAYNIGGVTSECDKVEHLAGAIDHMFYAHGWSREQCAEIAKWYEKRRDTAALFLNRNFEHYVMN